MPKRGSDQIVQNEEKVPKEVGKNSKKIGDSSWQFLVFKRYNRILSLLELLFSFQVEVNLFQFDNNRLDSFKEDADTSDSEESYYSGLESESETSENEEDDERGSVRRQYLNIRGRICAQT